MLRDWKARKTVLWFFIPHLDALHGPNVKIMEVSENPPRLSFCGQGSGETEVLDLEGVTFDKASSEDAPFPHSVTKDFSVFLHLSIGERKFVFGEPVH